MSGQGNRIHFRDFVMLGNSATSVWQIDDHKGELIYSRSRWPAALPARNEIRKSRRDRSDRLRFDRRIAFPDDCSSPRSRRATRPNHDWLRSCRLCKCRGTIPKRFRRDRTGLSSSARKFPGCHWQNKMRHVLPQRVNVDRNQLLDE
jgi:hypothetical protein